MGPRLETWSRDPKEGAASRPAPDCACYAAARDQQAEALAEEAIQISRNADTYTDSVTVGRLHIGTIKWFIAKSAPRRYGDKVVPDGTVKVSIGDAI